MKENYYYPAKMKFVDGNYQLRFMDFPDMLLIEEPTKEEAIVAAQESLALEIMDYEAQGKE